MRELGKPTVIVHFQPSTPEEVSQNRENVKTAYELALARRNGYATEVTINWGDVKVNK
jgi:hypothetical protein